MIRLHCGNKRRQPRVGGSRRAPQIRRTELLAWLPGRLRMEIEFRWRAPPADLNVVLCTLSYRHAFMRNIRNAGENLAQSDFQFVSSPFFFPNLLAHWLSFGHLCACILSSLLEFRDFF